MRQVNIAGALCAVIAATSALRSAEPAGSTILSSEMSATDLDFLRSAAEDQLMRTKLGDLAAKQSASKPVQTFAISLRKDAGEGEELKKLASEMQCSLPQMLNVEQTALLKRLARLKGDKFDKAWMTTVIQAQQKEITDFEEGARSKDGRMKALAQNAMPPLSEHLLLAKKISGIASAGKLFKARLSAFPPPEEPGATSSDGAASQPTDVATLSQLTKLDGSLDVANGKIVGGWACDHAQPNVPVSVEIYDGTTLLLTVVADKLRGDMPGAPNEKGAHCFFLPTPSIMLDGKPHWVRAVAAGSSFELPGSPKSIICQ